jgi:glycosyltransferase involved in cell wall biosynthesis
MAISQTVADDLITHLGVAPEKVVNIQGAPVSRTGHAVMQPKSVDDSVRFVLMTSGNDLRKNNINAVRGFEEYRAATGQYDLRLAITSHFDEFAIEELQQFSDGIIFTGNVTEQELKWLYDNAVMTLFVPEYEGLGLPILEAIEANKPIVCSAIGAFREMSETAFYYADHLSPVSIAAAISQALAGDAWQQRQGEYDAILKRYSWAKTAKLAVAELMKPVGGKSQQKKRLAVLTPTPKGYSAIGKVVQQMHASLAEHFVIDYYFENGTTNHEFKRESYLEFTGGAYDAKEFNADAYANYDAVLYHIGNSEFHINAIKSALYLPGYAVIHDTKLTEIFGYMNQLGVIVPERFEAERKLDETIGSPETDQLVSLVNNQIGVIVHSKYAQKAMEAIVRSDVTVHKLNLPTGTPHLGKRNTAGFTVGMAGVIHEGKGLRLLEELATMVEFGAVTFSIFGVPVAPPEVLERLKKNQNIAISTNLSDMDFQEALSGLDVLVNYREEYRGETSLSTLEAMRLGIVPIVRNIGWYGELPDSVAIKVDSGDAIVGVLRDIVAGKVDIEAMGNKAKKYAAQHHSYQGYSEQVRGVVDLPFSDVQRIERIKRGELFTEQNSR